MHLVRGVVTTLLFVINLAFWCAPVLALGLVKLFVPHGRVRRRLVLTLGWLAERFQGGTVWIMKHLLPVQWDITGTEGLERDGRYLIISNHVSWVDILAIFQTFHGKTAFPRFFIKSELIWMPLVGQAAWALEFPFMKRYTAEYLERHPEKRGTDLDTTRRACRRYRDIPVTILNFVEGTRFTREKQADEEAPYEHLLRPRIGGIAFVIASLGEQLHGLLDVTIIYPRPDIDFLEFVTGRIERVAVRVRRLEIPPPFVDRAITEPGQARERFKAWIEEIWREKDALIGEFRHR
jgi:1-acyl-sn-glycerol-3-phosphate acyltransferase